MKNSVLVYDKEELNEFIVSDYFSKDINVFDIFTELEPYLELYKMMNDDKLERLSNELYGTSDYWDILLMINDRNPLFEMPFNYDIILNESEALMDLYANTIYSHPPLTTGRFQSLLDDIILNNDTMNETFRFIYIIRPEFITNATTLLKQNKYI